MEIGMVNVVHPQITSVTEDRINVENINRPAHPKREKFDFDQALLNPDEVKNLLYLIVGAGDLSVIANKGNVGSNVNELA